jgi:hypothetical protein
MMTSTTSSIYETLRRPIIDLYILIQFLADIKQVKRAMVTEPAAAKENEPWKWPPHPSIILSAPNQTSQ